MAPCLLVTKSSPPSGGLRKEDPRARNDYDEDDLKVTLRP